MVSSTYHVRLKHDVKKKDMTEKRTMFSLKCLNHNNYQLSEIEHGSHMNYDWA